MRFFVLLALVVSTLFVGCIPLHAEVDPRPDREVEGDAARVLADVTDPQPTPAPPKPKPDGEPAPARAATHVEPEVEVEIEAAAPPAVWHVTYDDAYADAKGSKVLLVFWTASWCGNCPSVKAEVEHILKGYAGDVSAVALDYDKPHGYDALGREARAEAMADHVRLRNAMGIKKVPAVLVYDYECRNEGRAIRIESLGRMIEQRKPQ